MIKPVGVLVHSTGANNPNLKRYVQPASGHEDFTKLTGLLGVNRNLNDWNRGGLNVCVHAFIGKLADGSIATVQTLPFNYRGWHAGTGKNGSANNTHLSFEICEDGLEDAEYFQKVYREAVEFVAYLCKENGWNPLADGVVICHSEAHARGIASNHGDVMHWFPKHGKTMNDFRTDVYAELHKEDSVMTQEQFNKMMAVWMDQQAAKAPSAWSAEARSWAEQNGIVKGTGEGGMEYKRPVTREEMVEVLYRLSKIITM